MNTHYLRTVDDNLVPTELTDCPYFPNWNSDLNMYIKTKYVPAIYEKNGATGLKIAETLIRAISGPTMDYEAIRKAKDEFAQLNTENEL